MIPFNLATWAIRHHVSHEAMNELRMGLAAEMPAPPPPDVRGDPEAYVQSQVRLEAANKGLRLWRNNVGALADETGRFVRYGLANESEAVNKRLKSSDLIGWRPVTIGPEHVGRVIAQFVSRECKRHGWRYTGSQREEAQERWSALVLADGGDAGFTTGPGSL